MLFKYILFLAFLTPHVLASKMAGKYYVMYLWYAYRMDISASGVRPDMLAPGCTGSASAGSCTFDEFVRYLQRSGQEIDAGQTTSVGNRLNPDPIDTGKELDKFTVNGKQYIPNPDPQKIFRSGTFTGASTSLHDILDKVTDRIQAARTTLGDDGVMEEYLKNARKSIAAHHEARVAENSPDMVQLTNNYLKNKKKTGLRVETTPKTTFDGTAYDDLDVGKTVKKDSAFAQHWPDFLQFLSQQKGKSQLGTTKQHWNAIQGVQLIEGRVHGSASC